MQTPWLGTLRQLVERRPFIVLKFHGDEWGRLQDSRRGVNQFTVARSHYLLDGVKVPTPCLLLGKDGSEESLYFGLISSRNAVTTLESRLTIRRAVKIRPHSETQLIRLVSNRRYASNLKSRLRVNTHVTKLSPKLGRHLIERLASIISNRGAMRAIAESLSAPKYFHGPAALQEDAIRTALKAFGIAPDDLASSLELVRGRETGLVRVGITEDSVIEHDARHLPGYNLVGSDLTGRAVFVRQNDHLEVYTANRRPLEKVFGVDLIYLNASRENLVMLQYKMLERATRGGQVTDWIYRPDAKLVRELGRMRRFRAKHPPGPYEYRLNPAVFYLKFVKRDRPVSSGGIIMPIAHFYRLRRDPACRGPKGAFRVSYESLAGRYLRQAGFLDLIHSGYIGAHAKTTRGLKIVIEGVLRNNRAIVAAIQRTESIKRPVFNTFDEFEDDGDLDE